MGKLVRMRLDLILIIGIVNCSSCNWDQNLAITCSQTEINIEIKSSNLTGCPFNDNNYYKAYVSANEIDECSVGAVGHESLAGRRTDNLLGQSCISMGQSNSELSEIATNLFIRDEMDDLVMSMPITCQIGTHIEYKTVDVKSARKMKAYLRDSLLILPCYKFKTFSL